MINIKEKEECCGCSACFNSCPVNAIQMYEDEQGFKYPVIDDERCINCDTCEIVCPILNNGKKGDNPIVYACYNKDEDIRTNSSSGGVFTLLATKIINKGGIVFGATFDKNFNVKHIKIDDIKDIEKLRGSKYVQSDLGETYKQAQKALEKGTIVYYSGTPCQIERLKSYLQKDYDNLYTQDIVCHGVPSPMVWNKYKEYRKEMDRQDPLFITFRNKDNGWKHYTTNFKYENGEYKKPRAEDLYMNVFLQDLALRESCYDCKFKKYNKISDITLGDFWGIDKVLPEMSDAKGTSLFVINSKKGKKLFDEISDCINYKESTLDDAINYNHAIIKSVPRNPDRENFFKDLEKEGFETAAKRYIKKTDKF